MKCASLNYACIAVMHLHDVSREGRPRMTHAVLYIELSVNQAFHTPSFDISIQMIARDVIQALKR